MHHGHHHGGHESGGYGGHESGGYGGGGSEGPYGGGQQMAQSHSLTKPGVQVHGHTVKIYSEADTDFNIAVRGDSIVMERADDSDPNQLWIKDESWSSKAKDSAGFPAFSLINKVSGKALCRPLEAGEPVTVTAYHQKTLNEQLLWSMGKDEGHGYHAIRPVNDINLNLDIDHASKKYGGVKGGKSVILFQWKNEDNQKWKIEVLDGGEKQHHHFHL